MEKVYSPNYDCSKENKLTKTTTHKTLYKKGVKVMLLLLISLVYTSGKAQLSGTLTVPSTAYPTLKSACDSLNTYGVSGPVTVNVTANQVLTATCRLGSAVLNPTTSATNKITFQGNGNTIYSYAGTLAITSTLAASALVDGMLALEAVDNVTINNFRFVDTSTNTTTTTTMEFAIGMFNLSGANGVDGCKNISITNCNFNMGNVNGYGYCIRATNSSLGSTATLAWSTFDNIHYDINITGNTMTEGYNFALVRGSTTAPLQAARKVNISNNIVNNAGGGSVATYGLGVLNCDSITITNNIVNQDGLQSTTAYLVYISGAFGRTNCINNQINFNRKIATAISTYGIYGFNSASGAGVYPDTFIYRKNNFTISDTTLVTPTTSNTYYCLYHYNYSYNSNTSTLQPSISYVDSNTLINDTFAGSGSLYFMYAFGGATLNMGNKLFLRNNTLKNVSRTHIGGVTYGFYSSGFSDTTEVSNNIADNYRYDYTGTSVTTSPTLYMLYPSNSVASAKSLIHDNKITNIGINGAFTSSPNIYVSYIFGNNYRFYDNVIDNIYVNSTAASGGNIYGIYCTQSTTYNGMSIFRNYIDSLRVNSTSSGIAQLAYGIFNVSNGVIDIWDNYISNLEANRSSSTYNGVTGIFNGSTGTYNLYNNTIAIGQTTPISSVSSTFGASGVYYSGGNGKLINNIINIKGTAGTTGTIVAFRPQTTAVGAAIQANNNIYNVNAGTNNFLYGEGITAALTNAYYQSGTNTVGTLDANFNGACGLYKTFKGTKDLNSFFEDNLSGTGSYPGTKVPSGTSLAEGSALPQPLVTNDLNKTARPTNPDRGALEFTATGNDLMPPTISYNGAKELFCLTSNYTITATITDLSGVNVTSGTKPRMYYKKASENDVYGFNGASFNGWKYVEASNAASPFTFTMNYALLNSPIAQGDKIVYYIVAQDLASTPNVSIGNGTSLLPAGTCPTSVNINNTATLTGTNVKDTFTFLPAPSIASIINPTISCVGDSVTHILTIQLPPTTPPTYCAQAATSTFDEEIDSVSFVTIMNKTGCIGTTGTLIGSQGTATGTASQYSNFTTSSVPVPSVIAGQTYPLFVKGVSCGGTFTNRIHAYFDWNLDGDFLDADESYSITGPLAGPQSGTVNVTVPSTVKSGSTVMRIIYTESTVAPQPCSSIGTVNWGEVEDYAVNLIGTPDTSVTTINWISNKTGTTVLGTKPIFGHRTVDTMTIYNPQIVVNGCAVTFTDTVYSQPLPKRLKATNSTQCGAKIPTCSVRDSNNFVLPTINWYASATSGTPLQSSTDTTYTQIISSTQTLYVSVVNPTTGCMSPRVPVTITVFNADSMVVRGNGTRDTLNVCQGVPVNLTMNNVKVPPTYAYDSFVWTSNNAGSGVIGNLINATGNQTVTPNSGGIFELYGTAIHKTSTCAFRDTLILNVQIDPFTASTMSLVATPNPACVGTPITHSFILSNPIAVLPTNYCTPVISTNADEEIDSVSFGVIMNKTGCAGGTGTLVGSQGTATGTVSRYSNFTASTVPVPDVTTGSTYPLTVAGATCGTFNYTNRCDAFFDWNQDGDFLDAGERYLVYAPISGPNTATVNITVPANAAIGKTVMRIAQIETTGTIVANCATTYGYGEYEDYAINVKGLPTPPSLSLSWKSNQTGTTVLGTGNPLVHNLPAATTIYTVTVNQGVCTDSIKDTVTNNITPLSISGVNGSAAACYKDTLLQIATVVGGCTPYTYNWSGTGINVVTPVNNDSVRITFTGAAGTKNLVLTVTDNAGTTATFTQAIAYSNPKPSATLGDTICGPQSATLTATSFSPLDSIYWFKDSLSLAPIATGSPFVTGILNSDSTFYVREVSASLDTLLDHSVAATYTTPVYAITGINAGYGPKITCNSKTVLQSLNIYPSTAGASATSPKTGTVVINIFDEFLNIAYSTGNYPVTIMNDYTPSTASAAFIPQKINLGFKMTPGKIYYAVVMSATGIDRLDYAYNAGGIYAQTTGSGSATMNNMIFNSPTSTSTTANYYLWDFVYNDGCYGEPTAVKVKYFTPPAMTLSRKLDSVCSGSSTLPVTLTTPVSNYNTYTWNPNTSISGTAAAGYVFNQAVPATYTYELVGQQTSGLQCLARDTFVLKVKNIPTPILRTPGVAFTDICNGSNVPMNATSTFANSAKIGTGTLSITATGVSPFSTFYHDNHVQYLYTAAELLAAGFTAGNLDSLGYIVTSNTTTAAAPNYTITMGHTTATSLAGYVPLSNSTVVYNNPAFAWPAVGPFTFPFTTPFTWNGTSNVIIEICQDNTGWSGNIGVEGSTTTANMQYGSYQDAFVGNVCTSTLSFITNTTNRPNAIFYQKQKYPITWSPITSLFTNSTLGTAYVANSAKDSVWAAPNDTTKYFITATHPNGCKISDSISINVKDTVTITTQPIASKTYCIGDTLSIFAQATSTSPITRQWRKDGIAIPYTGDTLKFVVTSLTDSGTYDLVYSTGAPCGSKTTTTSVIKVNQNVVITTPAVDVTACLNTPITVVTAANFDSLTTWTQLGGTNTATGDTFFKSPAAFTDSGNYVITYEAFGVCKDVMDTVHVTIAPIAQVTAQPAALTTLCIGDSVTLTATATNAVGYQWLHNGMPISGATATSYKVKALTLADSGVYRLVALSANGCKNDTSLVTAGVVKINLPPTITIQPPSKTTTCQNSSTSFSVTASNAVGYQWYKNGTMISGATSSTYTIPSTQPSDAGIYTVQITGFSPCAAVTSTPDTLVVTPLAMVSTQPTPTTVCFGSTMTLNGTANNAMAYQWLFNGSPKAGATSSTLTIPSAQYTDSGTYRLVAISAGGCKNDTSVAVLGSVVHPVMITTNLPASAVGCVGAAFSLNVVADNATGYSWLKNGTPIGQTSSTMNIPSFNFSDVGAYSVQVAGNTPCPTVTSSVTNVTSTTEAMFTKEPAIVNDVCFNQKLSLSVTATAAVSVKWYKVGNPTSIHTGDTFTLSSASYSDAGSYYVIATAYNGCKNDTTSTFTITVSTPIAITTQPTASQTICVGDKFNLDVTATATGTLSYQWYQNGSTVGVNANSYGKSTAAVPDSGNYTVLVSTTSACPPVSSNVARVNVNKSPSSVVASAVPTLICEGSNINFSTTAANVSSVEWYKSPSTTPISTLATFTKTATAADAGDYYVIAKALTGCKDSSSAMTHVTVNSPVVVTVNPVSKDLVENPAETYTMFVVAQGTGPFTYQWFHDGSAIPSATNSSYTIQNYVAGLDSGNYECKVTGPAPCNSIVSSTTAHISTVKCPSIISQPISSVYACAGAPFSLDVTAVAAYSYQWFKNGVAIPGATYPNYSVSSATPSSTGVYKCQIINYPGTTCSALYTNNITVTIKSQPVITAQPITNSSCGANTHTMTVAATFGETYQWYKDSSAIPGANAASYTTNLSSTGSLYYCVVGNNVCANAVSNPVFLKLINPANQVQLAPTTTFDLVERCTDANGWTYFARTAVSDSLLFAIKKNGNLTTAHPDIVLMPGIREISANNIENRGAILGSRLFNLDFTNTIQYPYEIKFFFAQSEENDVMNRFNSIKAAQGARFSSTRDTITFINSTQVPFTNQVWNSLSIPLNIANTIAQSDRVFGYENGVKYVIIKQLVATQSGGCMFMDYFINPNASGISNAKGEGFGINIYPVPTYDGKLTLEVTSQKMKPLTFVVTDMTGRKIVEFNEKHAAKVSSHVFNFSDLANGNYQIVVSNEDESATGRFTIAK